MLWCYTVVLPIVLPHWRQFNPNCASQLCSAMCNMLMNNWSRSIWSVNVILLVEKKMFIWLGIHNIQKKQQSFNGIKITLISYLLFLFMPIFLSQLHLAKNGEKTNNLFLNDTYLKLKKKEANNTYNARICNVVNKTNKETKERGKKKNF